MDIFYATAKGKGINLTVEMSNPALPDSEPVLATDLIRLDKVHPP